ncbi:MAG: glycosyltransferase family 4 protein [Verrucomicrobiota bacterium]
MLVVPASYFAPNRVVGGGERYALEYARALAEHVPTTLALFDLQARSETLGALAIRTFRVKKLDERRGFPITRETWNAFGNFDVFHVMVFPTPLADLLALYARLFGRKLVLTDVGGGGTCWSAYLQKIHRRANLNRLAHGLAFLSEYSAGFFRDWQRPKAILHGGANLQDFSPTPSASAGYALFVGRLLPHKGVLPLIEALNGHTPLHIVGRPYDQGYLEQLRAAARGKQVQFILDADEEELRRQYAGANVALQPSLPSTEAPEDKSELLGLVAIEAMACGKPVIVTRTGSLPELVVDNETGFIVPPGDASALRARVEQLLSDVALSQRMGAAARNHVESCFTWGRVARRGLEFYDRLLGNESPPAAASNERA